MKPRLITVAVLALGGQGGGVLVDWIVDLAEHAGWTAQSTSVAGVAQRTGATIYYIEMVEPTPGREPVLALMAVPGEVDVLIAAELMEAGRAVERGLVTPDRTTVIASSHRTYAVQEKSVPGNGAADSQAVLSAVRAAARRVIADDMQALAVRNASVISSSLFGALAGSGALPFAVGDFEAVIERSGVGVQASLSAMRAAAQLAQDQQKLPLLHSPADVMQAAPRALPARAASSELTALIERVRREFPSPAWNWLGEGLARVADWQDAGYASEYLDRVRPFAEADASAGHAQSPLTIAAARWVAVAMAYDDVIRVADLKTRATRDARVRGEVGAGAVDVLGLEEYFHPRLEEVLGLLPERWARRIEASDWLRTSLERRLAHGRRIRTHTIGGFVQLRAAAGLRRWRRISRRHEAEVAHLTQWLAEATHAVRTGDHALAEQILHCRRLIKGYSDTHSRGQGRFDRLMQAARRLHGLPDAGDRLRQLREAALQDADGRALAVAERTLIPAEALSVPPR